MSDEKKMEINFGYVIYTKDGDNPEFPLIVHDHVFYSVEADEHNQKENLKEMSEREPNKKFYINKMTRHVLEHVINRIITDMKESFPDITPEQINENLPFTIGKEILKNFPDSMHPENELTLNE